MIQILAIAPYPGLANAMTTLAENRKDFQLTVKTGNLQAGVDIAKNSFYQNYDVIISRGGTAKLLRQELDIPVVEIGISVYDILRAIKSVENYTDKFAIVGYENITRCANTLCKLLHYQIDIFTIDDATNVHHILSKLKTEHYHMILCDMAASISARQSGMNSILITSGPESIQNAFSEAIQLYHSLKTATVQKDIFATLLYESDLNILLFNKNHELLLSSFHDTSNKEDIIEYIKKHIAYLTSQPNLNTDRKFKTEILSIHAKHIYCHNELFIVIYLKRKDYTSYSPSSGIYSYSLDELTEQEASANYCGSSCYIGNLRDTLSDYSSSSSPVLIMGETGTGKDKAATILYETGLYRDNLFYIIDCQLIPKKKWDFLLNSEASPFYFIHSTLYLKNIHMLSDTIASQLIAFCKDTSICHRNRMIFSIPYEKENLQLPIIDFLTNQLTCLTLYMPPLRERMDDLPNISSICINQLNTLLGKTIVGFEPDAMQLLQSFSWPQNLEQFKRILKELVITTHTPYISKESTYLHLKKETPSTFSPNTFNDLNLYQPLEEINYDIARIVIAEENGNQSKAARRLGISRSTLWRMLRLHSN